MSTRQRKTHVFSTTHHWGVGRNVTTHAVGEENTHHHQKACMMREETEMSCPLRQITH